MLKSSKTKTLTPLYPSGTLIVSYINKVLTVYIEKEFIECVFGPRVMCGKISSSGSETKGSFGKQPVELPPLEAPQCF